ncbi:hypothetical protein Tco_1092580 [Tanacetum coccineum]|uniref:Uncharacterized protein n=1 Tax=Tanacetum coccineum TaxID=301880 RepID=A0ABQ5ICA0_9ASTR
MPTKRKDQIKERENYYFKEGESLLLVAIKMVNYYYYLVDGWPEQLRIITESLVNISKRRAFWSLNEDILKINYSDNQYAVSIKEDTVYPCLHSPKTTKETSPIRPGTTGWCSVSTAAAPAGAGGGNSTKSTFVSCGIKLPPWAGSALVYGFTTTKGAFELGCKRKGAWFIWQQQGLRVVISQRVQLVYLAARGCVWVRLVSWSAPSGAFGLSQHQGRLPHGCVPFLSPPEMGVGSLHTVRATPASPDYSPASDTEFDPSEDLSSDHIPSLPAISPFLSSANDTTDSDTPDTPPLPTHGTPFTKTTLSTQRSPTASGARQRRVMVLAPG